MGRLQGDVVVIGAGITGASIARELSRYKLKVFLVEKEADVACGSTKANTATVHAGYDAQPGTWKAKLNVMGAARFDTMCLELGVRFNKTGTLVVALEEDQLPNCIYSVKGDTQTVSETWKLSAATNSYEENPTLTRKLWQRCGPPLPESHVPGNSP